MNRDQLCCNIGQPLQLQPPAIHLDRLGRELRCPDEDWIIRNVTPTEVHLQQAGGSQLKVCIGGDAVKSYTRNPSRDAGGVHYGFLVLTVQLSIRDRQVTLRPCGRAGERVAPPPAQIARNSVELIALGPDIVFTGSCSRVTESEWVVDLGEFIVGDYQLLAAYTGGFTGVPARDRYVVANELGDGRDLTGPPVLTRGRLGRCHHLPGGSTITSDEGSGSRQSVGDFGERRHVR